MKDRVPLYPGRVKLTPVAGQSDVYDMTRADQPTQQGDPLNKATLLKDATAALFGLGPDSVPDDVLAYLGKYNQYWWRRRKKTVVETNKKTRVISASTRPNSSGGSHDTILNCADAVTISGGSVVLTGSVTSVTCGYVWINGGQTSRSALNGKYFTVKTLSSGTTPANEQIKTGIVYKGDGTIANPTDSSGNYVTQVPCYEVVIGYEDTYVQSSDRSAYPDSGEQDGYEYQYIGIPFENAATAPAVFPKIATGSYVGTGKYGSSNPNSLTFEFEPKVVIISTDGDYTTAIGFPYIWGSAKMYTQRGSFQNSCTVSVSGNTMSYYNDNDEYTQMNTAKQKYPYIAIG